jgi:tetratricopeptide (TPR) repeat protein
MAAASALLSLFLVTSQTAVAPATPSGPDALAEAYFLFVQGRLLESSGNTDGAIAAYRKSLDIVPTAGAVYAELASLYARTDRLGEAVQAAEKAIGVEPSNRQAHRLMGFVRTAMAERPSAGQSAEMLVTQAIDHFEKALAGGRRDPAAELALGRLYVQAGRSEQAVAALRAFLAAQPGHPDAMMLLAEVYDGLGRTADATALLTDVIQIDRDQFRARVMLADLHERNGRWKDAASVWGDLVALGPRARSYRTRYATALVNAGDLDAGRRELINVTKDSPRDLSAWYLLSQVERRAGNAAGAEEAAKRIAEIDADDGRGPLALADAKIAAGDLKGAVAVLEPRVAAARENDVRNGTYTRMASNLALALQELGEQPRAIGVLEAAVRREPTDIDLQFELAAIYERSGRIDDAERAFRAVIAKDPQHAEALNYLGYMLAERGRQLDEAVALVKRALVLDAENPSFLDSLGWAYFKQGAYDNARDPLERAAAARPRNSVIQDHLGDLYLRVKRYRDAVTAFDRALAGDRDGIDVPAVTKKRDRARELAGR